MKKILLLACMTLTITACEKDPDLGQLDSDMVVYTDYDSSTDFGKFKTYFLPDSILEAEATTPHTGRMITPKNSSTS